MKQLTVFIFYLHVPNFVGKKKINPLHQKKDCLLKAAKMGHLTPGAPRRSDSESKSPRCLRKLEKPSVSGRES